MKLEDILKDIKLATTKKKSEIHKVDFANIIVDSIDKANNSNNATLEVLIYEVVIDKNRNEYMYNQYKNGYVLNHSVGMRYMKLFFCYNSENPKYSDSKVHWDKYITEIFNRKDAESKGYFWAVTEAKNIEASAVVKGSNFLTPVLSIEEIDENTIKVKCAISPSNIMDSHSDVHMPGIWKKSMNENNYDLFLQEHAMDFDKVIADSLTGEIKIYTELISTKELIAKFTTSKKREPSVGTPNKKDKEPLANTLDEVTIRRRNQLL